jgi:hypothetical protein
MTDRVDTTVDGVQTPIREPAMDRVAIDAFGEKLPRRDAPVLAPGDPGDDVEIAAHVTA